MNSLLQFRKSECIKYMSKAFEVFAIYLGFSLEESRKGFKKE